LYAFLMSLICATWSTHFIFLDLIILIIFCEYKLWNSSLYNFLLSGENYVTLKRCLLRRYIKHYNRLIKLGLMQMMAVETFSEQTEFPLNCSSFGSFKSRSFGLWYHIVLW
jgi:hypothetical protein